MFTHFILASVNQCSVIAIISHFNSDCKSTSSCNVFLSKDAMFWWHITISVVVGPLRLAILSGESSGAAGLYAFVTPLQAGTNGKPIREAYPRGPGRRCSYFLVHSFRHSNDKTSMRCRFDVTFFHNVRRSYDVG